MLSWAVDHYQRCSWLVALNKFEKVGSHFSKDRFLDQEPMDTVAEVFEKLVDSPVDPQEVRGQGSRVSNEPWVGKEQGTLSQNAS